jgi:hypothetical protein
MKGTLQSRTIDVFDARDVQQLPGRFDKRDQYEYTNRTKTRWAFSDHADGVFDRASGDHSDKADRLLSDRDPVRTTDKV